MAPPKSNQVQAMPSSRLHAHKQADPFSNTSITTPFGDAYHNQAIPFRINHGGVQHSLIWDQPIERTSCNPAMTTIELDYAPLLDQCCAGIAESKHPYVFLARTAFDELVQAPNARDKVVARVPTLIPIFRQLLLSKRKDVVEAGLHALSVLSKVVGTVLNPHVPKLLSNLSRLLQKAPLRNKAKDTLVALEQNGGSSMTQLIQKKIPTYR